MAVFFLAFFAFSIDDESLPMVRSEGWFFC